MKKMTFISILVPFLSFSQLQEPTAGRITNKVIGLKGAADTYFNNGVLIIRKGSEYSLINQKGETIFPYGKFSSISNTDAKGVVLLMDDKNSYSAYYSVAEQKVFPKTSKYDNFSQFLYNVDGNYLSLYDEDNEELEIIEFNDKNHIFHKNNTDKVYGIYKDVVLVQQKGDKGLVGLKDLNGNLIHSYTFNHVFGFEDNYAEFMIGTTPENSKYGIIDNKGKIIFQPQKQSISNLGKGFFLQEDKIINSKGEVLCKIPADFGKNIPKGHSGLIPSSYYDDGYLIDYKYIIDPQGNVMKHLDFLRNKGMDPNIKNAYFTAEVAYMGDGANTYSFAHEYPKDGCLFFQYTDPKTKEEYYGLYLTEEQKVITGGNFTTYPIFDSFSKLAYIEQKRFKNNNIKQPIIIKGFIDHSGDFVFIMMDDAKEQIDTQKQKLKN